jgi:hypothetical protein
MNHLPSFLIVFFVAVSICNACNLFRVSQEIKIL